MGHINVDMRGSATCNCIRQICGLLLLCCIALVAVRPALGSPLAAPSLQDKAICSKTNSHWSCVLGCFKCADFFGRRAYNMAACCEECQETKAVLLDDGPEYCSERFFKGGLVNQVYGKRSSGGY